MGKSGERSKKMIKTDKVIYHVKTVKEYDWLMRNLKTKDIQLPAKIFHGEPDLGVLVKNGIVLIDKYTFFQKSKNYSNNNLNHIEVSDLMENEEKDEILDKLEAINKQVSDQIGDLRKQGKEPKAIEYTIKVCFE